MYNHLAYMILFDHFSQMIGSSCANARDNNGGVSCASQLGGGNSCVQYLEWGDCDAECKLCACSTGDGENGLSEHCSGNGKCEAACTRMECSNVKCKCNDGFVGDKCQTRGISNISKF